MTPRLSFVFCAAQHATPWSLSWTLQGLFELTRCPSGPSTSPGESLPERQSYKYTLSCDRLSLVVPLPGQRQTQLMQTLIVRL